MILWWTLLLVLEVVEVGDSLGHVSFLWPQPASPLWPSTLLAFKKTSSLGHLGGVVG